MQKQRFARDGWWGWGEEEWTSGREAERGRVAQPSWLERKLFRCWLRTFFVWQYSLTLTLSLSCTLKLFFFLTVTAFLPLTVSFCHWLFLNQHITVISFLLTLDFLLDLCLCSSLFYVYIKWIRPCGTVTFSLHYSKSPLLKWWKQIEACSLINLQWFHLPFHATLTVGHDQYQNPVLFYTLPAAAISRCWTASLWQ